VQVNLLAYDDLRDRGIPYSRPHLWRLVRAGKFPKPLKLSPGGVNLWHEHEIDELIERRSTERGAAA
jgi:prophage regulatory protein